MALAWHLMSRLRDDRVLAPDLVARRTLARSVLERGASFDLLVFRAADTHLHQLVLCDRPAAGEFARRVELSLQHRLRPGVVFAPVHIVPVLDQRHLRNAFGYILRQEQRHGLRSDPGFEASNLPDLLGLRPLGAYTAATVRARLPRIQRADLLELLAPPSSGPPDLPGGEPDPLSLSAVAAAAACIPRFDASGRAGAAARRAAVHVVGDLARAEVGRLLGLTLRQVRRLRSQPPDPRLVAAIERRLALRSDASTP
jgi:hypothetical protein